MNKYTQKLVDFVENNTHYWSKIEELRQKHSNNKDFFENLLGYVIMDILNTQKQFFDYPRDQIQLGILIERWGQ